VDVKPLVVDGPPGLAADAVDRLAARLAREGRVAIVTRDGGHDDDTATTTDAHPAATRYTLADGRWHASGPGDLDDVLDRLAADHDYALLRGFDVPLSRVRVGDATRGIDAGVDTDTDPGSDSDSRVLATAADPATLDLDAVVDALDEVRPHVTLESLVSAVKRSPGADRAGAIATFTGRVRTRDDPEDSPTEFLEFEAHETLAERRLDALRADLEARDGVVAVRLHHRRGVVTAGEDIVFVVVLAGHREEAFRAVEDGIDRLKREVPLFKREVTVTGEFWAHERDGDGAPDR